MTSLAESEQYTDIEFESDVDEVAEAVEALRANPSDPATYEDVNASICGAKLLCFSISRDHRAPLASRERLLRLAQDAVHLAEKFRSSIPRKSKRDFSKTLSLLRWHARSLRQKMAQHA